MKLMIKTRIKRIETVCITQLSKTGQYIEGYEVMTGKHLLSRALCPES